MKDVLIVSEDPVGIMKVLLNGIASYTNYTYDYIDHFNIRQGFKYRNFGHRTKNFFLKNFSGRNLKHEYYDTTVAETIKTLQPYYKKILVIRPDLLTDNHLLLLRSITDNFIAYYWDTVSFFPRKNEIVKYFDKVFSFDPVDCTKYGFIFQSNFYYYENDLSEIKYEVYNLSSFDLRKNIIEKVAIDLEGMNKKYLFKGYSDKTFSNKYIKHTSKITYQQMIKETCFANVLLDVTKKGQNGLTLRPFEALGLNKKLITTNADIKNYDFYLPQNILVIDPDNPKLDKSFFETPYKMIPLEIKKRHHLKEWIYNIIN